MSTSLVPCLKNGVTFMLSITKGKTVNINDLPYPVGKKTKESFP